MLHLYRGGPLGHGVAIHSTLGRTWISWWHNEYESGKSFFISRNRRMLGRVFYLCNVRGFFQKAECSVVGLVFAGGNRVVDMLPSMPSCMGEMNW